MGGGGAERQKFPLDLPPREEVYDPPPYSSIPYTLGHEIRFLIQELGQVSEITRVVCSPKKLNSPQGLTSPKEQGINNNSLEY
jgi:hypothetical protein